VVDGDETVVENAELDITEAAGDRPISICSHTFIGSGRGGEGRGGEGGGGGATIAHKS
jgi:hypothetical protein